MKTFTRERLTIRSSLSFSYKRSVIVGIVIKHKTVLTRMHFAAMSGSLSCISESARVKDAHGVAARMVTAERNTEETGRRETTAKQKQGNTNSFIRHIIYTIGLLKTDLSFTEARRIPSINIQRGVEISAIVLMAPIKVSGSIFFIPKT